MLHSESVRERRLREEFKRDQEHETNLHETKEIERGQESERPICVREREIHSPCAEFHFSNFTKKITLNER